MAQRQYETFCKIIMATPMRDFHQGCCVGADHQAYMAMYYMRKEVELHAWPPADPKFEALDWPMFCDVMHPHNDYHSRDRSIVNGRGLVIATPLEAWPQTTSGTAYTMGYAVEHDVPVLLIRPDGTTKYL